MEIIFPQALRRPSAPTIAAFSIVSLREFRVFRGPSMKFLVTNDDGLDCVFLHELVHALREAGHSLAVVAPKHEQSWMGASKSRNRPVRSAVAHRDLQCPTWCVDG